MSQNTLIILLATVLAAVVAISAAVIFWIPTQETPIPQTKTNVTSGPVEDYDVSVTKKQEYQLLNRQLIQEGILPVVPPSNTGKANPFL